MTVIGFTGTAGAVTDDQARWVRYMLRKLHATALHHGDCVGADAMAHAVARAQHLPVHIHPPTIDAFRAFCYDAATVARPHPYLRRNADIAAACDALLAVPEGAETLRSGTWATVRYARAAGKPVYIYPSIYPEG